MRVRLRFSKLGKVRFTSHRDVARMWERALRRLDLPVARTEGFSRRPKLSFGLALPTGHESLAEYLDVELAADVATDDLAERLTPALPVGIEVTAAAEVSRGTASLQESVISCSWTIEALGLDPVTADELVGRALAADELVIPRTRKGRTVADDLRPAVLSVTPAGPTADGTELHAELAVHPRSARPAELLTALSMDGALEEGRVKRTAQWTVRDGARAEPLEATTRPHAGMRAS